MRMPWRCVPKLGVPDRRVEPIERLGGRIVIGIGDHLFAIHIFQRPATLVNQCRGARADSERRSCAGDRPRRDYSRRRQRWLPDPVHWSDSGYNWHW